MMRWSRPLIGLATVLIGLGSVAVLVIGARSHLNAMAQSLADTEHANGRLQDALVRGRQLLQAGAEGGATAFAADYLESPQDSIAAAALQSRLRTLALDRRVELVSLNTLTPRQVGDVTFVGVRLAIRAPLPTLQSLLHAIETDQPILFVERAAARVNATLVRAEASGEGGPPLTAEIDVYAPKRPRALLAPAAVRIDVAPTVPVTGAPRP